jgi:methyl-accepting chemotaxis protein
MNVITGHSAVTSDEFQNAISDIRNGNVALLNESNKAVVLFKEASEEKTYFLKTVQTAALILTFAVTVISLMLTNRKIVRPIEELSKGAEILGRGNLDHKVGTDAKDEVGELSRTFDQMIGNLKTVTASRDELDKEITGRKKSEKERERLILELKDALVKVKTLRGLLPICSVCNKIRDDKGNWTYVDVYIRDHSEAELTHGYCPECEKTHFPQKEK